MGIRIRIKIIHKVRKHGEFCTKLGVKVRARYTIDKRQLAFVSSRTSSGGGRDVQMEHWDTAKMRTFRKLRTRYPSGATQEKLAYVGTYENDR